jgi:hypothetical protein
MASGCSKHSLMVKWGYGSGVSSTSCSGAVWITVVSKVVSLARTTPISPSCLMIGGKGEERVGGDPESESAQLTVD